MELVKLHAGEGCAVRACGTLRIKLFSGVVECYGVPLTDGKVQSFTLRECDSLQLYTLEGGCVVIYSDVLFVSCVEQLQMGVLVNFANREVSARGSRIVCIGSNAAQAACTIVNLMTRNAFPTILCDVSLSGKGLSRLGCVGAMETHKDIPLGEGFHWADCFAPTLFFNGLREVLPENLPIFTSTVIQATECSKWMSAAKFNASTVFIAPETTKEVIVRAVLDCAQPSHIVIADNNVDALKLSLSRLHPNAKIVEASHISSPSQEKISYANELRDYFFGRSPCILGASTISLPLSSLTFVELNSASGVVRASQFAGKIESICGRLFAVSLGTSIEEVPFANIAGLLLLVSCDSRAGVASFLSPSSDALPSQFLILEDLKKELL